jgi:hypothetical protein
MPLKPGKSKKVIRENIKREIAAGRPRRMVGIGGIRNVKQER